MEIPENLIAKDSRKFLI